MDYAEIDLEVLKSAVNALLDHLIEDLGMDKVPIDPKEDFYWDCCGAQKFDPSPRSS